MLRCQLIILPPDISLTASLHALALAIAVSLWRKHTGIIHLLTIQRSGGGIAACTFLSSSVLE
jgi:hypothetical protein